MTNIFGYNIDELNAIFKELNIPSYRSKQISDWIYKKGKFSFYEMTNLSKNLQENLAEKFKIITPILLKRLNSKDNLTSKFLLELEDKIAVETVLMRKNYGNSVCVSTQAGCAMGCAFCASTLNGVTRNLTAKEMLGEVYFINNELKKENKNVTNIVLMGSGEPLMNYDEVIRFLRLCHDENILGLSYRNITLSTSGIVPNIYRLAEENLPVTLSISLHAPNDKIRDRLMPINKKYPIKELIKAGKFYGDKTKRRVTYEYILIDNLNDGKKEAKELASLLKNQLSHINIIPINSVEEREFFRPSKEKVQKFLEYLTEENISATVRKEMGADVNAACGQLRNRYLRKGEKK
ncbi:MAG: 23S rRNA (adenine(2503)-C(2))-methyltransferase RlmN [Selenomonadaceae bacterium]|nr:23S rRNA (adenine(2503)-C(2))-methyltransferase RlmN [Selenomonadaceae bacterium]